jgi:CBS domain-containing protein
VFDYEGGKQDWFAAGLLAEGSRPAEDRVSHHASPVPTCPPSAPIVEVARAIDGADAPFAVVLDDRGVILGRIRRQRAGEEAQRDPSRPAEDVMKEGPSTYRPNVSVDELLDELRGKDLDDAIITTGDGVFLGVVDRSTLERAQSLAR